jgi:transposase InsO family protein/transposase-like protein
MPWKEICPMDQKAQLIGDFLKDEFTISELHENYNVSRKTIYKWIARYKEDGFVGLDDESRAPLTHPNVTPPEIVDRIIDTRLKHHTWGPKKVVAQLKTQFPEIDWPVPSTAGSILKKEGLVKGRYRKRHTPPYTEPFRECGRPNDVWSIDYKGQFRMLDGKYCYPLTLTDNFSRYLLLCHGLLHPNFAGTKPWLKWAFQEYGLPLAIKSDNGTPFASVGLGGLSPLSVWLIKLWIRPERIEPAHPEQNGRHERMHLTLKEEATKPPKSDMEEQQKAFDLFREEFNTERPHEALGQKVPASIYTPSGRVFPKKVPKVEYESFMTVRQVRSNGCIKWKGGFVYVSEALAGEPVGLKQIDESEWEMQFSFHKLGILDERIGKVRKLKSKHEKV